MIQHLVLVGHGSGQTAGNERRGGARIQLPTTAAPTFTSIEKDESDAALAHDLAQCPSGKRLSGTARPLEEQGSAVVQEFTMSDEMDNVEMPGGNVAVKTHGRRMRQDLDSNGADLDQRFEIAADQFDFFFSR